jgi:hypothetical protein
LGGREQFSEECRYDHYTIKKSFNVRGLGGVLKKYPIRKDDEFLLRLHSGGYYKNKY